MNLYINYCFLVYYILKFYPQVLFVLRSCLSLVMSTSLRTCLSSSDVNTEASTEASTDNHIYGSVCKLGK